MAIRPPDFGRPVPPFDQSRLRQLEELQASEEARRAGRRATAGFDVDQNTAVLLAKLQQAFKVDTNAAVISKALALAKIASEHAGPDNTVTIVGEGKPPVKVSLAE
jgi:hypothetical protein